MGDNVTLAIVDAIDEPAVAPSAGARSRYLASIANVPLIRHVFDELAEGGVERALVVSRAAARPDLEEALQGGKSWGVDVSYADAPEANARETVRMQTSQALSSGPVLVYPADCLFPGQVAAMRDRFSAGDVDCVLLALASGSSLPEARAFATAVMLGPRTQELLGESTSPRLDPPGLIEMMLAGGCRVAVCEATKQWFYNDSTERLLTANRMVLDDLPVPAVEGTSPDHNQIHGRIAISPQARVSNCTLYGPLAIDHNAVVEDSFLGPYTAIGRGATVIGAELDNTMVLPLAEVRHPGFRIEASIIGERASVVRSFELPKGLHMRLMPGSRVTLS